MTSVLPAPMPPGIDTDAVLCALALAPSTYSRNKHPDLYADVGVRRAQRRARVLRSLVRQVLSYGAAPAERGPTGYVLRVDAPELGYRREARLTELEHDLVLYLLARARGEDAPECRDRIESVLARLAE
jgi:hypothetical protein